MYNISRAEGVYFKGDFSKRNKIFFEENLRLRGRKINYVWCILNEDVHSAVSGSYYISDYQTQISGESLNGKNISFSDTVALTAKRDAVAVNAFLTLVSNNKEILRKIPLTAIYESTMKGEPLQICENIDFEKSFIECQTGRFAGTTQKTLRAFFVFGEGKEYDVNAYNLDTIEVIEAEKVKNQPNDTNLSNVRCEFPDNEYLRGSRFYEISIHDGVEYKGAETFYQCYTPDAKNLVDKFTINHSTVTFVDGDSLDEVFYNIPLCCLSPRFTTHGPLFGFDKVKLNLKRSYITDISSSFVLDASATAKRDAVFYFTVKLAK